MKIVRLLSTSVLLPWLNSWYMLIAIIVTYLARNGKLEVLKQAYYSKAHLLKDAYRSKIDLLKGLQLSVRRIK